MVERQSVKLLVGGSIPSLFAALIIACSNCMSPSAPAGDSSIPVITETSDASCEVSRDGGGQLYLDSSKYTDSEDAGCETVYALPDDAGKQDLGCGCIMTPATQKHCYGREHPDFGTSYEATCTSRYMAKCSLDRGVYCCP